MKEREPGFLNPKRMPADVFDYIVELHELLWRVARIAKPGASGELDKVIEPAIISLAVRHGPAHDIEDLRVALGCCLALMAQSGSEPCMEMARRIPFTIKNGEPYAPAAPARHATARESEG